MRTVSTGSDLRWFMACYIVTLLSQTPDVALMKQFIALCLFGLASVLPWASAAPPEDSHLAALETRLQTLEAESAALRAQAESAAAALAATRAELQAIRTAQAASPASAMPSADALAPAAPPADAFAPIAAAAPAGANGNAFNPAISLILNGSYTAQSVDPARLNRSGFPFVGEGGPAADGFSLGESEISFAANIDDKFYGQFTVALGADGSDTELGIEEAFIDSTALPGGFIVRAGRFFSNLGYLNSHHTHTDKFFARPLAYQALLGNQYLDDGVQLRWVAPTRLFLELGGEVFRGGNFPSGGARRNGAGVKTVFAHAGGDIGVQSSWLAGISVLDARTADSTDGFSGDNTLYVADATWKWAPQGNFKDGGLTLRGEFLLDDRSGRFSDPLDPARDQPWVGQRRGGYLEGIVRLNRRWETGYRYDRLWADREGPFASSHDPERHSLMLSWLNSEFSLLRLQLSQEQAGARQSDESITLQYQTSLGAHGAHKF